MHNRPHRKKQAGNTPLLINKFIFNQQLFIIINLLAFCNSLWNYRRTNKIKFDEMASK